MVDNVDSVVKETNREEMIVDTGKLGGAKEVMKEVDTGKLGGTKEGMKKVIRRITPEEDRGKKICRGL